MRKTQKFAIVGGTVSALLVGGVAYAAWTSSGTGTGDVTAGQAVTLGVHGTTIGDLYPNNSVVQTVTVSNPNPYDVKLSDLTPNNATITSDHVGCTASSVTAAQVLTTAVVPARVGSTDGTTDIPVTVSMDNTANDACQLATFTISYTAHGLSN